jgi:hypothetical protein
VTRTSDNFGAGKLHFGRELARLVDRQRKARGVLAGHAQIFRASRLPCHPPARNRLSTCRSAGLDAARLPTQQTQVVDAHLSSHALGQGAGIDEAVARNVAVAERGETQHRLGDLVAGPSTISMPFSSRLYSGIPVRILSGISVLVRRKAYTSQPSGLSRGYWLGGQSSLCVATTTPRSDLIRARSALWRAVHAGCGT